MTMEQMNDIRNTGMMNDFLKARKELNQICELESDYQVLIAARAYHLGLMHGKREERIRNRKSLALR